MNGYVARKGNRWYAVIYEGLDPVTGKEIRRWHPAGTDEASAEKLARQLARDINGADDAGRGLSFGAFLTKTWLPAKRIELRPTTWHGYQRIVNRHALPVLGSIQMRRLRPEQLEEAPRQRPAVEQTAWTAYQLATFLRHAAGHRYFPAIWTTQALPCGVTSAFSPVAMAP